MLQRCLVTRAVLGSESIEPSVRQRPLRVGRVLGRVMVTLLAGVAAIAFAGALCARDAPSLFRGELALQTRLADGVARWGDRDLDGAAFGTGSARFDGEWLFGSSMMAAAGLAQVALEHPELADRYDEPLARAIHRLLEPRASEFTRDAWNDEPLEDLDGKPDHAAHLGYLNFALGLHRLVDAASPHADLNERISRALADKLARAPLGLLATYPGEVYPVDNAAVVASLVLRDRAAGRSDHAALAAAFGQRLSRDYVDPTTGLLAQYVDAVTGARGAARGSGTLLAVYFLSFADRELSGALWASARRELEASRLGFGAMAEYPVGAPGSPDIDSGPVVLGLGVSATGFALAGARIHGDEALYAKLWATTQLFGAPHDAAGVRTHVTGGPLGDAILLAMATAPRATTARATAAERGAR
jgi:hypothetical protein